MAKCHFWANHCKKMNTPAKDQKEKKDCDGGGCNPFSVCNYFPVMPSVFPVLKGAEFVIVNNKFNLFNDIIYSGYYRECWHPPWQS